MILVTGGAGFIGSNLMRALNARGLKNIIVIDNLTRGNKSQNLVGCEFVDYIDKVDFRTLLEKGSFKARVKMILHQGACSDTTELDSHYMLDNNFTYSKILLHYALENHVPFIYASSAAVYGRAAHFEEDIKENEAPLNLYGFSKVLFDHYVRSLLPSIKTTLVGLRYFNVYGPFEAHKGKMASMIYQLCQQLDTSGEVNLFSGTDGYPDGEQRRDFIYVDDVIKMILFFMNTPGKRGIYNAGTGRSASFNDIAHALISLKGLGKINYVPFPSHLQGKYQSFTEASLSKLKQAGYTESFESLNHAIRKTISFYSDPKILL